MEFPEEDTPLIGGGAATDLLGDQVEVHVRQNGQRIPSKRRCLCCSYILAFFKSALITSWFTFGRVFYRPELLENWEKKLQFLFVNALIKVGLFWGIVTMFMDMACGGEPEHAQNDQCSWQIENLFLFDMALCLGGFFLFFGLDYRTISKVTLNNISQIRSIRENSAEAIQIQKGVISNLTEYLVTREDAQIVESINRLDHFKTKTSLHNHGELMSGLGGQLFFETYGHHQTLHKVNWCVRFVFNFIYGCYIAVKILQDRYEISATPWPGLFHLEWWTYPMIIMAALILTRGILDPLKYIDDRLSEKMTACAETLGTQRTTLAFSIVPFIAQIAGLPDIEDTADFERAAKAHFATQARTDPHTLLFTRFYLPLSGQPPMEDTFGHTAF